MALLLPLVPFAFSEQRLELVANEVTVIEGLEEQGPTLEELVLYQNHIKCIDNIQHLTNLRWLPAFLLAATSPN